MTHLPSNETSRGDALIAAIPAGARIGAIVLVGLVAAAWIIAMAMMVRG